MHHTIHLLNLISQSWPKGVKIELNVVETVLTQYLLFQYSTHNYPSPINHHSQQQSCMQFLISYNKWFGVYDLKRFKYSFIQKNTSRIKMRKSEYQSYSCLHQKFQFNFLKTLWEDFRPEVDGKRLRKKKKGIRIQATFPFSDNLQKFVTFSSTRYSF